MNWNLKTINSRSKLRFIAHNPTGELFKYLLTFFKSLRRKK